MEISLTPELERFVREKVNAGRYPDANSVIAGALEAFIAREAAEQIESLREQIASGISQLDAGQGEPWSADEIKAQGRRALAAKRQESR